MSEDIIRQTADEAGVTDPARAADIRRMRAVARLLDSSFRVPGTNVRFGLDPIVGALPVAGDGLMAGLSLYILVEAARLGVSKGTLARMLFNVAVDVGGGAVPVAGDLFDVAWRASQRNVRLALADLGVE